MSYALPSPAITTGAVYQRRAIERVNWARRQVAHAYDLVDEGAPFAAEYLERARREFACAVAVAEELGVSGA